MDKQSSDTGIIFDIDHFAVHDGPGIRTCIYFKGCPLSCQWCHSPESQLIDPQVLFAPSRCIGCGACVAECRYGCQFLHPGGKREFLHDKCNACMECIQVCPTGAMFLSGKKMKVEEIMEEVLADRVFFQNSGGGVTLSGGEILLQAEFAGRLLSRLKKEGIHTIVETSGYGATQELLHLAKYVDIFYYDYKLGDRSEFEHYIGGDLSVVLHNLERLREVTEAIVLRIPLIPGITDTKSNIESAYQTALRLNITEIHLLPYNAAAGAKYEWCGRTYELGDLKPDFKLYDELKNMAPDGLKINIMY